MSLTTREKIIETRSATKRFTSSKGLFSPPNVVRAVNEVSLEIKRGETFSIVGESGCGKSTLARLLVRLLAPSEGSVLFEGNDISSLSEAEMRRLRKDLQFVFQDPFSSLNPRMTVGGIIEEPLKVHTKLGKTERRQKVAELLLKVGLRPDFANRYPHEFSGGQRQRIGIARALASGPKVIVGDEPVSALDVSVQAQVINLLEDLKTEFDLTLILIAHDLAVIRHMSDRIAVMYLGEVVELAGNDALYERPLHPYTQALMRAIPVPSPHGRSIESELKGDIPSPLNPPSGCRFHTRCPHATEKCSQEKPLLTDVAGDRQVACFHWEAIADANQNTGQVPQRSEAAEKRFTLFRRMSRIQEQDPAPTPSQRSHTDA